MTILELKVSKQILISLAIYTIFTYAYPDGAPDSECDTMQPSLTYHGPSKLSQAAKDNPYVIAVSTNVLKPGQGLAIRIVGPPYKGVIMQARHVPSGRKIGEFVRAQAGTKLIRCPDGAVQVTHDGSKPNLSGTLFFWKPPTGFVPGFVVFYATIVIDRTHYLVRKQSSPVQFLPK